MRRPISTLLIALAITLLPTPGWAATSDPPRPGNAVSFYDIPYRFVDQHGQATRLDAWRGRAAIIAMDHTQSLLLCSDTIRRLRAVQVAADRMKLAIDFIVLSLEPAIDTPEAWRRYQRTLELERDNWRFLTASAADTVTLIERLGVVTRRDQGYLFHDVKLFRVDADGRVARLIEAYDRDAERFLR